MTSSRVKGNDELAFNVQLVAYDHGIENRVQSQQLGLTELKRNTKIGDVDGDNYTRPPLTPTHEELSTDRSAIGAIWVGMRPSNASEYLKNPSEKSKGCSVNTIGVKVELVVLKQDDQALRVVAPMDRETASYYALVDQKDGLCTGVSVVITEVFFFPEFRVDEDTSNQKRKSSWSDLVRKAINPLVVVAPRRALSTELSSVIGTDLEVGQEGLITNALEIINAADTDGFVGSPPENTSLAKLATSTTKLTVEDCKAALDELLVGQRDTRCDLNNLTCLQVLVPELKELSITSNELENVSAALVDGQTVLPYAHLRAFLVLLFTSLRNDSLVEDPVDLVENTKYVAHTVALQLGGKPVYKEPGVESSGRRSILDGPEEGY